MTKSAGRSGLKEAAVTGIPRRESEELLKVLTDLAQTALTGVTSVTLTLGDPADPADTLTHDVIGQAADGCQWRATQGPTFDAYRTGQVVISKDMRVDGRWPVLVDLMWQYPLKDSGPAGVNAFSEHSAAEMACAAIAVPLCAENSIAGVLTLYIPHGALVEDVPTAVFLPALAHAAVLLLTWRKRLLRAHDDVDNMRIVVANRAPMEQAKGIVAVRLGISPEQAFTVICAISQDRNIKAHDIAAVLVAQPQDPAMDVVLRSSAARLGLLSS